MSKVHILRCLVNERLTAAAEEIFALFERTIAEYEEELCRSKDENQRKQQILDSVLRPQVLVERTDAQIQVTSREENCDDSPHIKEETEEQSINQLQEFTAVSVKGEEQSEQQQTVDQENCEGSETNFLFKNDINEDWEPPASSSTQQMETEADGDYYNQVQIENKNSVPLSHMEEQQHYDCSVCGEAFHSASDLQIHFALHKVTPYSCSQCDAQFCEMNALNDHMKVHKVHKCPYCYKYLSIKSSLKAHMAIHTSEKPFSCSICEKTFKQKMTLKVHMGTHTEERPYSCPVCAKTFKHKGNVTTHLLIHTGQRPFKCSLCGATFSLKQSLETHVAGVHRGERPFSCSVCGKCFSYRASLRTHVTIHTGVKYLSCPLCPQGFNQKCFLTRHMRAKHPEHSDRKTLT